VNIKRDVSIFESDDLHSKPVQLEKFKKITEGQVVFAISYPKDQDETLTEAHIANIDSNKTINSIKTSLSLGMHASGGGLFNSNGKLVGIIDYNQYSTQNYAIPVSDIENVNVLFSGISNNNDYPEQKKSDAQVQVLTANISTFSEAASMKEQKLYIESDEQKYVSDAISKSELLGLYDVSSIPDAYDNWPSWRKNLASMELLRVVLSSANDSGLAKDEIVRLCIEDGRKMWSDIADRYCTQIPGATFTDLEGKERACPQPH